MADYIPKDMSGSLWPNDKGESPKRPDCRGNCMVNGTPYEVAGWKRTTKDGRPWLSLSFSVPRERQAAQSAEPRPAPNFPGPGPSVDDPMPF